MDKQTSAAPEVQPCLATVLAHVSPAVLGTCRALSRVTEEPSIERRVLFWRIFGTFSACGDTLIFHPCHSVWAFHSHWRDTVAINRVADGDRGSLLRGAWPENEL